MILEGWNFHCAGFLADRHMHVCLHVDNIEVLWFSTKIEENSRENANSPSEIIWPNCPTISGAWRTVACYFEKFRAQAYQLNVHNEVASSFFHQIVH